MQARQDFRCTVLSQHGVAERHGKFCVSINQYRVIVEPRGPHIDYGSWRGGNRAGHGAARSEECGVQATSKPCRAVSQRLAMTRPTPFGHSETSPEIIRLTVMMCRPHSGSLESGRCQIKSSLLQLRMPQQQALTKSLVAQCSGCPLVSVQKGCLGRSFYHSSAPFCSS